MAVTGDSPVSHPSVPGLKPLGRVEWPGVDSDRDLGPENSPQSRAELPNARFYLDWLQNPWNLKSAHLRPLQVMFCVFETPAEEA